MAEAECPYCHGSVSAGASQCVWCYANLQDLPPPIGVGDQLLIKNPFKGARSEEVTVVEIYQNGWAIEVRDAMGMIWGYIKPEHITKVLSRGRRR